MTPEHSKHLYETYPVLYRQHTLPMSQTCMCWGFECGDGWFELLDRLSKKITALDKKEGCKTEAVQVKEKFGTLRFYIDAGTEQVFKAIEKAEKESAKICEDCGKRGKLRGGSWLRTLCDACDKKRKETR